MKLVSYERNGRAGYGAIIDSMVAELSAEFSDVAPTLKLLLQAGALANAHTLVAEEKLPLFPLSEVTLAPVIPDPGQIFCIGLNYADHVSETGRLITESPTVFLRVPASQTAHGHPIILPAESGELDFEGEIAIVIGKGGRRISEDAAWSHIAGYSCYNDASIRDWQAATTQWTAGKNFWRTGAFGPWMVTADEIRPDQVMTLVTRLNGVEVQRSTTDLLIHSIPRQIAYLSTFTPLAPGDVIVTGTPGGVGFKRQPKLFMKAGDTVEVEVDAIGVLRNSIEREASA